MFKQLFLDHPRSVGESYFQHQRHALAFGARMAAGAAACFLHALVPAACVHTGSRAVRRLHDKMVVNRLKEWETDDPCI